MAPFLYLKGETVDKELANQMMDLWDDLPENYRNGGIWRATGHHDDGLYHIDFGFHSDLIQMIRRMEDDDEDSKTLREVFDYVMFALNNAPILAKAIMDQEETPMFTNTTTMSFQPNIEMDNYDLEQAIVNAHQLLHSTSKSSSAFPLLEEHLHTLLSAQQARATTLFMSDKEPVTKEGWSAPIPWELIGWGFNWIAMDLGGEVYVYTDPPEIDPDGEVWDDGTSGSTYFELTEAFRTAVNFPTFNGDWRSSMRVRPE